jgi:hypothetical protein
MSASKTIGGIVRASLAVAAVGLIVTTTGCQRKTLTEMNSCSCACRQETETTVTIANKNFYSNAECGSYEGADCNVNVKTSSGSYTVSGRWEGCTSNGKVKIYVRVKPDQILEVVAAPEDVLPPPPLRNQ